MSQNDRLQLLLERIQEDERLRGDLSDSAATALVEWASQRVTAAAADPSRPDADVDADVQAIRAAARTAARSGENDSQRVIALADAALADHQGAQPSQPAPAVLGAAEHPNATPTIEDAGKPEPAASAPIVPATPPKDAPLPSMPDSESPSGTRETSAEAESPPPSKDTAPTEHSAPNLSAAVEHTVPLPEEPTPAATTSPETSTTPPNGTPLEPPFARKRTRQNSRRSFWRRIAAYWKRMRGG